LNISTEYKYDSYGNVREVNDPNGDVTQLTYNQLNLLTKIISPLTYETNFSYNKNKKLEQIERVVTGGPSQMTHYAYDILDHLNQVTDPCGYVTTYGYNKSEEPNIVTDAEDNNTVSVYDERGLLIKVTDANGGVTEYGYTPNGDINDINDAKGNITGYKYDGFGRLTCITYPDDTNEVFSYDKNSNITSRKNRKGETIEYEYDAMNRLKVKSRESDPNICFSYDIAGRVAEVNDLRSTDQGGVTTFTYDRIGRVNDVNTADSKLIGYGYDSRGLRTKLTYPDDSNVAYEYDSMLRLKKVKYNGSSIAEYAYDELSRRTLVTLGNDSNAVYEYDIANKLTKLTNNIDVGSSITFEYDSCDKVGNRKSCKIDDADAHVYQYDNLYQLIFVDYNDGNSISYAYDPLGNRTNVNSNGLVSIYDTNCLNQYTAVGPQGSQTDYLYDKNGNLADINNGQFEYVYDCENRLIEARENSVTVATYAYDFAGRRVSKTTGGVTTRYVYDGDQIIAEYQNDTLVRKFIYGPGIDEPICMSVVLSPGSEVLYYYHFDGLGSVVALSDNDGDIVERYSYDVFGEPNRTSNVNNPYLFTGRAYDSETGLYYYRARYYKPSIGRFLQTDPVGYIVGFNLYTYCGNNPLNFHDPSGLCKIDYGSEFSGFGNDLIRSIYDGVIITSNAMTFHLLEGNGLTWWADSGPALERLGTLGQISQYSGYVASVAFGGAFAVQALGLDVVLWGGAAAASNPESPRVVGEVLTGYTNSGLNDAISHPGGGVSPQAILETIRQPLQIIPQEHPLGPVFKYVGQNAVVILNESGQVVSAWPVSSIGTRGTQ
jgi:RHS repeat-associated protein